MRSGHTSLGKPFRVESLRHRKQPMGTGAPGSSVGNGLTRVLRPAALLFSGSAAAQLIPFAATPLVSRLFSPQDYGLYALSLSIVAIAVLIAGGSYNQAINLASNEADSLNLAKLGIAGGAGLSTLLLLAALVELSTGRAFQERMWFIPAATVLLCVQNSISPLATRKLRYGLLVRSRIGLAGASTATTLLCGMLHLGERGLMIGYIAGLAAACALLLAGNTLTREARTQEVSPRMCDTARRFSRFPRWQLGSSLIDALATQLPVWTLSSLFGNAVLGQFSFASRTIGLPLQLVGNSLGEVFRQQSSSEWNTVGHCRQAFRQHAFVLSVFYLPTVLLLLVGGPWLFRLLFGERWIVAGEMIRWLGIVFALKGSVGSLSYAMLLADRQRIVFLIHLLLLACAVASFFAAAGGCGAIAAIQILVGASVIVYIVYACLVRSAIHGCPTVAPSTSP